MKKILIFFGGCSTEYGVSLQSAAAVLAHLDQSRYQPVLVGITRQGAWRYYPGGPQEIAADCWQPGSVPCLLDPSRGARRLILLDENWTCLDFDAALPLLHGKNGEDGTIQGLFQLSGIPYVGCNTLSSAVCMDKAVTHTLLSNADIEQAHYLWFYADRYFADGEKIRNKIAARLNFPVFVKPANAGSSVGVSTVTAPANLVPPIRLAPENDTTIAVHVVLLVLVLECAVLGNRVISVPSPLSVPGPSL